VAKGGTKPGPDKWEKGTARRWGKRYENNTFILKKGSVIRIRAQNLAVYLGNDLKSG